MTRAVHEKNENQNEMIFYCDETDKSSPSSVKVVIAPGDGNCMLQSSAHQMLHLKMNSQKSKSEYKKMRAAVVAHIKQNYGSFVHEIKGHVYDIRDEQKENGVADDLNFDIDKECLFFLNTLLPKNRCWTGAETLKALSII